MHLHCKDVSDIHSLASQADDPLLATEVYDVIEKPEPLREMLKDPVEAVLPHLWVLRVACSMKIR